jgi:hypothetical protein
MIEMFVTFIDRMNSALLHFSRAPVTLTVSASEFEIVKEVMQLLRPLLKIINEMDFENTSAAVNSFPQKAVIAISVLLQDGLNLARCTISICEYMVLNIAPFPK